MSGAALRNSMKTVKNLSNAAWRSLRSTPSLSLDDAKRFRDAEQTMDIEISEGRLRKHTQLMIWGKG